MTRRLAALAVCVVACSGSRDDAPPHATAGSAPAVDPWSGSATHPDAGESAAERKQRAEAALARVAQIMPELAKLRELAFEHDIPRAYRSSAELAAFVREEIAKELPPATAKDRSAALYHIGLLPSPVNLAELEERALTSQAGAYYATKTKSFYVVLAPNNEGVLDAISAHELTHGLQDQHFDLQQYLSEGNTLDDDQQIARRFVVEGDATFTMFLYAIAKLGVAASPEMIKLLRAQLDQFAAMSPDEMRKQNLFAIGPAIDPAVGESLAALGDLPPTVLVPIFDSYLQGAQLVATAHERGGWKAVDALYREPPASTEQVLHPATKLYPVRDRPHRVVLATAAAGTEIANLVLGELQWQVYFTMWAPADKTIASEGWGGDRVSVRRRADGRLVARIATIWDTVRDANELRAAFARSLAKRFPKGTGDVAASAGFDRGDGAGKIFVAQDGAKVYIVDGADDAAELGELVRSTRFP